jgi:hypothetical protein
VLTPQVICARDDKRRAVADEAGAAMDASGFDGSASISAGINAPAPESAQMVFMCAFP